MKQTKTNKSSSLCWYCKRTIDETLVCPWVDDGVPVQGWEVSDEHKISKSRIRFGTSSTATVIKCPLFERYTDYIKLTEYLNKIAEEIGVKYTTAHSQPQRLLDKYTKQTGKDHPAWVKYEMKLKEFNKKLDI